MATLSDTDSISTYVMGRQVFTHKRRCSAPAADGLMYWETLVWEWNPETRTLDKLLDCRSGGLTHHLDLVRRIAEGRPLEDADDSHAD